MLVIVAALLVLGLVFYFSMGRILIGLGEFIIHKEKVVPSDIVVVLNTGQEYYPRLIEAADLILPTLQLEAAFPFIVILTLLGFPIALVLAWAVEITPEGIQRAEALTPEQHRHS